MLLYLKHQINDNKLLYRLLTAKEDITTDYIYYRLLHEITETDLLLKYPGVLLLVEVLVTWRLLAAAEDACDVCGD